MNNGVHLSLKDQADRTLISTELNTTVFVEAGAGSGKTHAMVERIAALLKSGVDIGSIAAITFTEKAAGELRDRLRKTLEKRIEADPDPESPLRTALDRLDAAPIGTIHSFAARLISEYPIEAGVPPLITVVDELRSQLAFERRWETAQQTLFTDPSADNALRVLLAVGVTLDQLRGVAKALDSNWDRLRDHPPVKQAVPTLEVGPLLRAAELVLERKADCTDPADKLMARFPVVEEWRSRLQEVSSSGDLGLIIDVLNALPAKGYSGGKQGNWGGDVKGVQQQFLSLVEERDALIAGQVSPAVNTVSAVLAEVLLAAAKVRQRSGELEYHDLLIHARDLLVGETDEQAPARLPLNQRYTHLMLDEFQDTDPVQAEIAVRLAASEGCGPDGWESLPIPPGRLFMVGDPKQSIYRFRRADIATFLAARSRAAQDAGSEIAALQTNFRSTTRLLDWINTVFGALIQANGTVQPPYAALSPAPDRPIGTKDGAGPAVAVIGRNGAVPGESGKVTAADRNRQEAADVASAILVATGSAGRPAWLHEAGKAEDFEHRPLELKDICILLPTRTALPYIEDALDAAGIEYRAEASSLVYSTQEVIDLLLALRALANTADQAALVLTLRSALFACGDDDLFRWKQAGGSWNLYGPVPEGLETTAVGAAMTYLSALHRELQVLTPAELLERIAADRRVLEAATDTPRYRDVWRRIRFVADQARAWTEATHGGLRDYLAWAGSQQEENARVKESMVPETDLAAVRIMTIHASKGLEFPMVVLSGAGSAPRSSKAPVLWDNSGRAQVHFVSGIESHGYAEAAEAEKEFADAERRRLLYVACTRAESHLIVSHYSGSTSSLSGLLASVNKDEDLATDLDLPDDLVPQSKKPISPVPVEPYADWALQRERWMRQAAREARTSVTALAKGTDVSTDYGTSVSIVSPDGAAEMLPGVAGIPAEHGPAFGTALHRLLELTDLAVTPSLPELAAGVAAAAGLRIASDLEAAARSALESDPVRRAAVREHWLELRVVVPEGDHTVDGIIDLMYREDDGSLVIADFKTDVSIGQEQLSAYWRQLGTYARMVERITEEKVSELVLILCRADEAGVLRRNRG